MFARYESQGSAVIEPLFLAGLPSVLLLHRSRAHTFATPSAVPRLQKGPIKVYALGLYSPSDVFDAPDEASLWSKLRLSKSGLGARGIVCVLTFKVSAQKMSGALIDSLKPRFKGPSSALDALSDKIVEGCSGGGGKGTVFEFLCLSKDKIQVSVNGNDQGVVEASNVGGAFADIYLDEKGVR